MKRTATALISVLIALALSGTAIGSLSDVDLPNTNVPTGGTAGQAIGCHLVTEGFGFAYGKNGVPETSGTGDGECEYNGSDEHSGDVTHSVLKVTGSNYGYTTAYGYTFTPTYQYAQHYVYCPEPATLLVEWGGDVTYLEGADCTVEIFGDGDLSELDWYSYGGGYDDVKFVHTDNLVDALVHLLV